MGDPAIPPGGPGSIGGPGSLTPKPVGGGILATGRAAEPGHAHRNKPDAFVDAHPTLDLNPFQLHARTWFRWKCDRPVVLIPNTSSVVAVLAGQALAGPQAVVYYVPGRQPNSGTASMALAQASKGAGVVYLPHAGWWNLYWDAANSLSVLDYLVIDASDPAVASRYLFEAGIHGISTNTTVVLTVGDILVLASNRLRKGFLLSMESAIANPARFGFNAAASNVAGLRIGGAQLVTSFGMAGENCFQGEIRGTRDATAVADVSISVVEWF